LKIIVGFLATYKEVAGTSEITVDIEGDTVGDVIDALVREYGDKFQAAILEPDGNIRRFSKVLINGNFADRNAPLKNSIKEGDTVVFVPPIAGG